MGTSGRHVCGITSGNKTAASGVVCFNGTVADKTQNNDVPPELASPAIGDSVIQVNVNMHAWCLHEWRQLASTQLFRTSDFTP